MVLRVRWRAGCLVTSSIPLKRGHDEYQITTRTLAVLKNLANSFPNGSNCTSQITGSVDLSEMDCIARRRTHDFRQPYTAAFEPCLGLGTGSTRWVVRPADVREQEIDGQHVRQQAGLRAEDGLAKGGVDQG